MNRLLSLLGNREIPHPLISQNLAALYPAVSVGLVSPTPKDLLTAGIRRVLSVYEDACRERQAKG